VAGVAREAGHRLLTRLPLRALPGGWAPPVYALAWWLTEQCDLRCSMCWVEARPGPRQTAAEWLSLADQVRRWRPRITLTGGEPSLHPEMLELAAGVKSRGLYLSLNTNGLRLAGMSEELVSLGLDDISVSLDGMAAGHDTIRGRPGAWSRTVEGIRTLLAVRGDRGWPVVRVTTVVSAENVDDLEPLHRTLADLGVDCHTLQHRWFVSPALLEAHEQEAGRRLGLDAEGLRGFLWDTPTPVPGLREQVDRLQGLRLGPELVSSPDLSPEETESYYRSPERALRKHCVSRWYRLTILPDGQATPCLGLVVGSVREQAFGAIWNGAPMRRFRRDLAAHGHLPGCLRCCGLFSDQA
jgi:MoaA/NifB/PqqE/SkfB family radical SAM enzyme